MFRYKHAHTLLSWYVLHPSVLFHFRRLHLRLHTNSCHQCRLVSGNSGNEAQSLPFFQHSAVPHFLVLHLLLRYVRYVTLCILRYLCYTSVGDVCVMYCVALRCVLFVKQDNVCLQGCKHTLSVWLQENALTLVSMDVGLLLIQVRKPESVPTWKRYSSKNLRDLSFILISLFSAVRF